MKSYVTKTALKVCFILFAFAIFLPTPALAATTYKYEGVTKIKSSDKGDFILSLAKNEAGKGIYSRKKLADGCADKIQITPSSPSKGVYITRKFRGFALDGNWCKESSRSNITISQSEVFKGLNTSAKSGWQYLLDGAGSSAKLIMASAAKCQSTYVADCERVGEKFYYNRKDASTAYFLNSSKQKTVTVALANPGKATYSKKDDTTLTNTDLFKSRVIAGVTTAPGTATPPSGGTTNPGSGSSGSAGGSSGSSGSSGSGGTTPTVARTDWQYLIESGNDVTIDNVVIAYGTSCTGDTFSTCSSVAGIHRYASGEYEYKEDTGGSIITAKNKPGEGNRRGTAGNQTITILNSTLFVKQLAVGGPAVAPAGSGSQTSEQPACVRSTGGLSWFLCDLINMGVKGVNTVTPIIVDLLEVTPLRQTQVDPATGQAKVNPTTGEPLYHPVYQAWGAFRNLANIAFILVFLYMIVINIISPGSK